MFLWVKPLFQWPLSIAFCKRLPEGNPMIYIPPVSHPWNYPTGWCPAVRFVGLEPHLNVLICVSYTVVITCYKQLSQQVMGAPSCIVPIHIPWIFLPIVSHGLPLNLMKYPTILPLCHSYPIHFPHFPTILPVFSNHYPMNFPLYLHQILHITMIFHVSHDYHSIFPFIPSGKLTFCYGKSPFLMGKSTINHNFQ